MRSATFTDRNPVPTGVVSGPFRATLLRWMDSSTDSGRGVPSSVHHRLAGFGDLPLDVDVERADNLLYGVREIRADPVARYESNRLRHAQTPFAVDRR